MIAGNLFFQINMIKLVIILFSFWFTADALVPKGIDYEDRTLQKEVSKFVGDDHIRLEELNVPARLFDPESVQGKFFRISQTSAKKNAKYAYVGRVNSCRQGGCSNPHLSLTVETPEYFDYVIVFDDKPAIQLVSVYNYQATHGQEVSTRGWLKQFQGYSGEKTLVVGKSIDGISGATVSVHGITADVQEKVRILKKIIAVQH